MSALYTVNISRQRPDTKVDGFLFGFYRWEVEVQPESNSTRTEWELRGTGSKRSIKAAKRAALKHIISVQKDIDSGVTFGVQFVARGDFEEIKKELSE